ncbi:hypothetical protein KAX06_07750 [candidate division WOR-3 bacterium]|nr:hypothetical protein [candidate division WOR-3 bacterium]
MKKLCLTAFVVFMFIFIPSTILYARKPSRVEEQLRVAEANELQLLIRMDGEMLFGRIVKIVADYVHFEIDGDTTIIFIPQIKEVREVTSENIKNGRYWFPNPNATRLYLCPTARLLGKGTGYVAAYYILAPLAAYGVTDNFTIAGGASFLTAVNFGGAYLLPKVGVALGEYVSLSAGVVAAQGFGEDGFNPTLLLGYGAGTFGRPDVSISVGAGYGVSRLYTQGPEEKTTFYSTPGFMLGGELRVARKIALVTENYFIREWGNYRPVISYGMRFFGETFSLEGAFIYTKDLITGFPGFPFGSIVYNF